MMNIRGKFYFKFMWNVMTTLWHSWDLTIKLNLESETVTSWSELTNEKTEIDSEDKQQEKYKDLSSGFLFDSGMREDMCFWQYLQSKKINQLILSLSELAGFQPRLCLLSLIDKWKNVLSGILNISTCDNILYASYWKWYISSFFNL